MNVKNAFIQKQLWAISGNEVWIIKDCPTAHKYYSRQGFLFVMTFFFAAFCGAFAGNEFGSDWTITIMFGLIWGLLVYSIDQMMVQTIDKVYVDTITTSQKFWKYFFSRIFLGCLLALFMSSPLDHFLFREQIEDQMQKNADANWMKYQKDLKSAMDISGTESRQKEYKAERDSLVVVKGHNPNTIAFKNAKANYDRESSKLTTLEAEKNNNYHEKNRAWDNIPTFYNENSHKYVKIRSSDEYPIYLSKKKDYDNSVTNYNKKYAEEKKYKSIMDDETKKNEEELSEKIAKHDTVINKLTTKIESINDTIENKTKTKQEFVSKLKGFDTKFMTLLTHPKFGVQFLRWFIFLVFLTIEILPTWMKLMGKPTEYDIKLDKIKKKRITEFETSVQQEEQIADIKKENEIQIAIEKEKQRATVELDLHNKTLANIADRYEKITKSILQDWEDKVEQEHK